MTVAIQAQQDLRLQVSQTILHHIDGIAIGSTVWALLSGGVFDILTSSDSPVNVGSLAKLTGRRGGFLNVALRLLAHQGFLRLSGDMDSGRKSVSITDAGIAWLEYVHFYEQIPQISYHTSQLRGIFRKQTFPAGVDFVLPRTPGHKNDFSLPHRIALHMYGEMVAVIMTDLSMNGIFDASTRGYGGVVALEKASCNSQDSGFIANILELHAWGKTIENGILLTEAGNLAAQWAPQYYYPVSYLSTFRKVPRLISGEESIPGPGGPSTDETHVDRNLDIKFSGIVFDRTCRRSFLDISLPIFDREPLEDQPASIVDTGSGDGTLLVELFRAIRERTLRGRFIDSFPLAFVGVEYTQVAAEATKNALIRAGVPFARAVSGDIGHPVGIAETLVSAGIDPENALHVNKSVIHNRTYKPPKLTVNALNWKPLSQAPFVAPNGELIRPRDLECNLVEFFEAWKPLCRRHGMVVLEAHTVDPALVCLKTGHNIITCMDATHGYSGQLLIEYEAFSRIVKATGYRIIAYRALSGQIVGKPTMTIHHLIPMNS